MQYWLVKTEPSTYSIDDLQRDGSTLWEGVRNYQARNNLAAMAPGDKVVIYHSSTAVPGCAGVGTVRRAMVHDPTAFDPTSAYFDPKSTTAHPRWVTAEIAFAAKFERFVPLAQLRREKPFSKMQLLRRGNRLSVTSITKAEFDGIIEAGG